MAHLRREEPEDDDLRVMSTIEGFGISDHAHIVSYAGRRGQGVDRYTGPVLGDTAVQRTIQVVNLGPYEGDLEARLDRIEHEFA